MTKLAALLCALFLDEVLGNAAVQGVDQQFLGCICEVVPKGNWVSYGVHQTSVKYHPGQLIMDSAFKQAPAKHKKVGE